MIHVLMESAQVHNECGSIGQGPGVESRIVSKHTPSAHHHRTKKAGDPSRNPPA